jgi:uncharacterized protein (TIGR01370 family)
LVEPNPRWGNSSFRVDIRNANWQELLIYNEASRFLQRGAHGFMLDTLDTAAYLERKDPRQFAGSRQALRDFLARLRSTFPEAVILANGTDGLFDASPHVDGYVVESVFATHEGRDDSYRATDGGERSRRLAEIAGLLASAPKPIFSIDYAGPANQALAAEALREARARGFRPFIGLRALDRLPSAVAKPPTN